MKTLFATLVMYQYNTKILHWKVKGNEFDTIHNLMNDYTTKIDSFIDTIAELMIMNNQQPLNIKECISLLEDSKETFVFLDINKDYSSKDAIEEVNHLFTTIYKLIDEAKKELTDCEKSILDETQYWFKKEVNYLNKRRL